MGAIAAVAAVVVLILVLTGGGSEDAAVAAKINLRASDLPGFVVVHDRGSSGTDSASFRNIPACRALPFSTPPGESEFDSPNFEARAVSGSVRIKSAVTFTPSTARVAADLALVNGPNMLPCFEQELSASTSETNAGPVHMSDVQVARVTPPATAASQGFGIEAAMSAANAVVSLPVNAYIYGFVVGRNEVTLVIYGVNESPSQTELAHLARLLVDRAEAHPA